MPNDKPETLAGICARVRKIDESMMRDLDFMAVFLKFLPRDIEAAAERERDAYNAIISGCEATAGELAKERDRAVQYANAAPHPGSASWKEMQAQARKVATLRDSLVEILNRTKLEKARDYDAALNGGILEIHDIANTALDETKGE